ncbi:hypothetical protein D8Y22_16365 [Salinadaptatus halalkaliphilus]|uniref:PIN domain-containing protein n=1 Tax=Salinadaptatus halalkaliphilus TaxID=2419781 RepID=A0A4S3TIK4_9EURY|nr:hypothetical protein [Salinadaptatus halalkaliphilus]THE63894.1 hypothetical protein D8Y22_16365 [Salinadaptatus halalkaliphilus]
MSGRRRLRTIVADTSALVSLGVVSADPTFETDSTPDPLRFLLTSCTVSVPPTVVSELRAVAQYDDIHAAAATNVLAARPHYSVVDPYERTATPDSRPSFGLDDGETDAIVLANALEADGVLTDEFGGTNFALVHAALVGPRIVPTPRLVCDYDRNGYMETEAVRTLLETIGDHRSWDESPYVAQLLAQLDE